jgi:uncharacterized linocin/CFP29 family protein
MDYQPTLAPVVALQWPSLQKATTKVYKRILSERNLSEVWGEVGWEALFVSEMLVAFACKVAAMLKRMLANDNNLI